MKMLPFFIAAVLIISADSFPQNEDSTKTYELEQITINADKELKSKIISNIEFKEIERADAGNLSQLSHLMPSVKVQTNSRGETLFYLRGTGERQIMLFLDGVPLNIPWDNRIDLSLIPAEAIGNISVTRGIPSVIYGANAVSGVVNISTLDKEKDFTKLTVQMGENNSHRYSGLYLNNEEDFSYLVSTSFDRTGGYSLPESYNSSSNPGRIRLNSDSRAFNILGKFDYSFSNLTSIGFGISYINAEKGVPPETDVSSPRFWRYPVWKRLTLSLNGDHSFGKDSEIDFSFAATNVKMQIDQYQSASYSAIDDIEKGDDFIFNGRVIFTKLIGSSSILKAVLNGFTTTHKENIKSSDFVEQIYVQNMLSAGVEYEYFINSLAFISGISYDVSSTPKTGDKPAKDANHDYSFNLGIVNSFDSGNSIHISFGRKTRFPTLRETFSGALGRFVPNPSLKAEVAYAGEVGFTSKYPNGMPQANLFLRYLQDGIVRASLAGGQFQRINENEIRNFGVEISTGYRFFDNFSTDINFSYLNSAAKDQNGEFTDTLEYKPEIISSLRLIYSNPSGFEALVEGEYIGKEFGLQEGNEYFHPLPTYFLLNLRLSYKLMISSKAQLEFYARVNNIFDKLYFTQWSLPEAGRQFFAGISAEL